MNWLPIKRRAPAAAPADAEGLCAVLAQWLRLKGRPVPQQVLRQQLAADRPQASGLQAAAAVIQGVDDGVRLVQLDAPQLTALPLLCQHPEFGLQVVMGQDAQGLWICAGADQTRRLLVLENVPCLHLIAADNASDSERPTSSRQMMLRQIRSHWAVFVEAAGLSMVLSAVGIAISFYTMQVYDRVIPNQGFQTLWVLTVGVALAVLLEWLLKLARAALLEPRLKGLDVGISKAIMARLNAVRLDQRPGAVGTLASQVQSFESIRTILSTSTLFLLFDMPMALLFAAVIAAVGGV